MAATQRRLGRLPRSGPLPLPWLLAALVFSWVSLGGGFVATGTPVTPDQTRAGSVTTPLSPSTVPAWWASPVHRGTAARTTPEHPVVHPAPGGYAAPPRTVLRHSAGAQSRGPGLQPSPRGVRGSRAPPALS
jgi:hypothetical protein